MWTLSERVYVTRYDRQNAVMVRADRRSDQIEFYMQNDEKGDWHYCFSITWREATHVTGETKASWSRMVGITALVRAYREKLAPFAADDSDAFARQVDTMDFFPDEALRYSLRQNELVSIDAVIDHINLPERPEGVKPDTATVLLRDRTGTMVAFVDKELFPEFINTYEESQHVKAIGRVYLPNDPQEGTPAYLDLLKLEFR